MYLVIEFFFQIATTHLWLGADHIKTLNQTRDPQRQLHRQQSFHCRWQTRLSPDRRPPHATAAWSRTALAHFPASTVTFWRVLSLRRPSSRWMVWCCSGTPKRDTDVWAVFRMYRSTLPKRIAWPRPLLIIVLTVNYHSVQVVWTIRSHLFLAQQSL